MCTLSVAELPHGLARTLDGCAHNLVGSGGSRRCGEATLFPVNQNLIWTQKGESDIPRSSRDQGTRLSYPLTHDTSLCELITDAEQEDPAGNGRVGQPQSFPFNACSSLSQGDRSCVWNVQAPKREEKPDELVWCCVPAAL